MSCARIDRARNYRERAEKLRALADTACFQESRIILMRLADDYEKMAAGIEAGEAARTGVSNTGVRCETTGTANASSLSDADAHYGHRGGAR